MNEFGARDHKVEELALEHAWKWFEYHANQRMTMIRFYLTAAGGLAAGFGFLLSAHENIMSAFISIIGVFTSISFKNLDRRVSDLVKIGEEALKPQQSRFGRELKLAAFEICRIAGEKPKEAYFYTYGQNFRLLFNVLIVGFAMAAIVGLCKAIMPQSTCLVIP